MLRMAKGNSAMEETATQGEKNKAPQADDKTAVGNGQAAATPSPAGAGAPPAAATGAPKDDELAVLKDRFLRLQADFDNFRKRTARDRDDHNRRATEKILKDLLPVVDHLELGLQSARKQHIKHTVIDGFAAVVDQLGAVLERAGVTPIPTEGQVFDPQIHECVSHAESKEHPENTILTETRRGYKLGTYLLRAPQVIVSSGPRKAGESRDAGA